MASLLAGSLLVGAAPPSGAAGMATNDPVAVEAGAWHWASASWDKYDRRNEQFFGDFDLYVEPDGGCCTLTPQRWEVSGLVYDRACDAFPFPDHLVEIEADSSEVVAPSAFVVAPDLSRASTGGSDLQGGPFGLMGQAVSQCDGLTYPFVLWFEIEATGPVTTHTDYGVWGVERIERTSSATADGRFCWRAPGGLAADDTCTSFQNDADPEGEIGRISRIRSTP